MTILIPSLWVKEQTLRQKLKSLRLVTTKQLGVITGNSTGEILTPGTDFRDAELLILPQETRLLWLN